MAFITHYRHYDFLVMFFEWTNALTTFMRLINVVFKAFLDYFVTNLIDDIFVYLKSKKDSNEHLLIVLGVLGQQ